MCWLIRYLLLIALAMPASAGGEEKPGEPLPPTPENVEKKQLATQPRVTIGRETTFITGPLDEQGQLDFFTAINNRASQGVTAENNAAVELWRIMGPLEIDAKIRDDYFRALGIEPLSEEGDYFLPLSKYLELVKEGKEPGAEHLVDDDPELAGEKYRKILDQHFDSYERVWTAAEFPIIAGWLAKNDALIDRMQAATRRSRYYSPLMATKDAEPKALVAVLLPGLSLSREMGRALVSRAMFRLGVGEADAAQADLLACHRWGRLISQGPLLIDSLVGGAISGGTARDGDLAMARSGRLTSQQLLAYAAQLRALPPLEPIVDRIDFAERLFFVDSVLVIARTGSTSLLDYIGYEPFPAFLQKIFASGVDWNVVLKFGNQWYDKLVAAGRETDFAKQQQVLATIDEDFKAMATKARDIKSFTVETLTKGLRSTATDRMGAIMLSLLGPAIGNVYLAEHRFSVYESQTQLALALAAYRADQGKYPAELAELAPRYLEKLPLDRFSGKPFVYVPRESGYLLYSVGPNGQDDGGRSRYIDDGESDGDDLSVKADDKTR